jgi:threonylcarbamoyladenosine tRNA methylthiotransferase MtaB
MPTFSIENLGCRATDADAAALRQSLRAAGLSLEAEAGRADFIVLNTCTVTAAADAQSREVVRKFHKANPSARIIVTGCYAERAPEELASLEGVAWVVGNSHQSEIPRIIGDLVPGFEARRQPVRRDDRGSSGDFFPLIQLGGEPMSLERGPAKILSGDIFAQLAVQVAPAQRTEGDRTRPILKIQDGCNNRCSYCVIPFVRGRSRSLPPDAVVSETNSLIAQGAKEIVLSGINLGAYGRELAVRTNLQAVTRRILNETPLERLRFSSIEPQDITEDFVSLAASSNRIAGHFHVPLQSGSDRILRAMHRWYRAGHYEERVKLIKKYLPHAAIGADVIVGFPGESEADFLETLEFIERLPFSYLHVFSFSARPGTAAAHAGDAVPPAEIRRRARLLRQLSLEKAHTFRASEAGRTLRTLTLARGGENWTEALTENYLKTRIAGQHSPNCWFDVTLAASPDCLHEPVCASAEKASSTVYS